MDIILQATAWKVIIALTVSWPASDGPTNGSSRAGQNLTGSTVTFNFYHCEIWWHSRLWLCPSSVPARSQLEHEGPEEWSFLVFSLCRTSNYPTLSFIFIRHTASLHRQFGWSHATLHLHSCPLTLFYLLLPSFILASFTNTSLHLPFLPYSFPLSHPWLHPLHTTPSFFSFVTPWTPQILPWPQKKWWRGREEGKKKVILYKRQWEMQRTPWMRSFER